jgi:hypothetical protein
MSGIPEFNEWKPGCRASLHLRLAACVSGIGMVLQGGIGVWLCGIGWWWLRTNPVFVFYTMSQMGLRCPLAHLDAARDRQWWNALAIFADSMPGVVLALPGELLIVAGLVLILVMLRRLLESTGVTWWGGHG